MLVGKGSSDVKLISGEELEKIEAYKYQGVWFDRWMRGNVHLKWKRQRMGGPSKLASTCEWEN